jgi:hypothetical protein
LLIGSARFGNLALARLLRGSFLTYNPPGARFHAQRRTRRKSSEFPAFVVSSVAVSRCSPRKDGYKIPAANSADIPYGGSAKRRHTVRGRSVGLDPFSEGRRADAHRPQASGRDRGLHRGLRPRSDGEGGTMDAGLGTPGPGHTTTTCQRDARARQQYAHHDCLEHQRSWRPDSTAAPQRQNEPHRSATLRAPIQSARGQHRRETPCPRRARNQSRSQRMTSKGG